MAGQPLTGEAAARAFPGREPVRRHHGEQGTGRTAGAGAAARQPHASTHPGYMRTRFTPGKRRNLPTLTYLPHQRSASARTRARPPALSPALGLSHRIPRFRRGALGGGRATERVRILQPDLSLEAWGWQPWVGAARKNVVGVVRRLVGKNQVTSNQSLLQQASKAKSHHVPPAGFPRLRSA